MNRRDFFKNVTVTAGGIIIFNELIEPRRMYWPGASFNQPKFAPLFRNGLQQDFMATIRFSLAQYQDDMYGKLISIKHT